MYRKNGPGGVYLSLVVVLTPAAQDASPAGCHPWDRYFRVDGVYPHLAVFSTSETECGIGAVVPWAGRLFFVTYVAHKRGSGVGLYEISEDLQLRMRPESVIGTHAGRMIHRESNQLFIGPYVIGGNGSVRLVRALLGERVTAICRHLADGPNKVYALAMEGGFYEVNVRTLSARKIFDLKKVLDIRGAAHFKGAYTAQGKVIVANNSYGAADSEEGRGDGRLAEWDGKSWTVLERTAFCEVTTACGVEAVPNDRSPVFASGWDRASVILKVLAGGKWYTYRLPKGSRSYDHAWCTEWPRIRAVARGRLLFDMHGLYWLLGARPARGGVPDLTPLASHLKMTPDFCLWNGKLVLAGNDNSVMHHRYRVGGQPQSNLWFGGLKELSTWGSPSGWGGPFLREKLEAGKPSDPFFAGGFEERTLFVWIEEQGAPGALRFEIQSSQDGAAWTCEGFLTSFPQGKGYRILSADPALEWVRLVPERTCVASAQLFCLKRGGSRDGGLQAFRHFASPGTRSPVVMGALVPFAGSLWCLATQVDGDLKAERTLGLYRIGADMRLARVRNFAPQDGVFTNRKIVVGTPQGALLSIGPYLVDKRGNMKCFTGLKGRHICSTIRHPFKPGRAVLFLTAEGLLLEGDLQKLTAKPIQDIARALGLCDRSSVRFRAGHCAGKTVIVSAAGAGPGFKGFLAEWDGEGVRLVRRGAFGEVCNMGSLSEAVIATGVDDLSALVGIRRRGRWEFLRFPVSGKALHECLGSGDLFPRVREVVTERLLVDIGGGFYELSSLNYAPSVKPVATTDSLTGDFCSWRGLVVFSGLPCGLGEAAPRILRGGGGVRLWIGSPDTLWRAGRFRGRGAVWLNCEVHAGVPSEPFLFLNAARREIELVVQENSPAEITVEVDPVGTRRLWIPYRVFKVGETPVRHAFPKGFNAHWVRVRADKDCRATAVFVYR